jgi:hypothetical protein
LESLLRSVYFCVLDLKKNIAHGWQLTTLFDLNYLKDIYLKV